MTVPPEVVITRKGFDAGVNTDKRVYVTGPYFGVYSSTPHLEEASRFSREEAERLLAERTWRHLDWRIEEAP
jgi:hypothetical protein